MSNANEDADWQPWKLSIVQRGGGSRHFLQSCSWRACRTTLSNISPPDLASALSFNAGWNFERQLWIWALCSVVRRPQKFIRSCSPAVQTGRLFRHRGCYWDNLLYSQVTKPVCSWHVAVMQSEKTPAKMQLLKISVGGFFSRVSIQKVKTKPVL